MYLADIDAASRALVDLELVPLQIRQFHLVWPSAADIDWVRKTLDRESRRFGARVTAFAGRLALTWKAVD